LEEAEAVIIADGKGDEARLIDADREAVVAGAEVGHDPGGKEHSTFERFGAEFSGHGIDRQEGKRALALDSKTMSLVTKPDFKFRNVLLQ
jgi:hypothetical protein